jgi:hypothetical protein
MIFFVLNFSFAEKNALELQACQVAAEAACVPATRASGAQRHSVITRHHPVNWILIF